MAVLLATSSACASESVVGPSRTSEPATTAYDIYRTVLTQRGYRGGGPIVVLEETTTFRGCGDEMGRGVGEEWRPAIESFDVENGAGTRLAAGEDLGVPYVVVPRSRIDDIFAAAPRDLERGWQLFRQTYPGSVLLSFSAVGFDPARTRAVVHMSTSCGSLCGEWRDYYVEKQGGQWVVTPVFSCWAVA